MTRFTLVPAPAKPGLWQVLDRVLGCWRSAPFPKREARRVMGLLRINALAGHG